MPRPLAADRYMRFRFLRLLSPLLFAAGFFVAGACERRPVGVDFSVDREYDFDALRRVAIVDPPDPGKAAGFEHILVEAASDALGERYVVVYGNRLRTALRAAGAELDYGALRQQIGAGREPDAALMRKIAKAIGVDAFYATELAGLDRRFEPDYAYATVLTSTSSGYASISQTQRSSAITTVRLTGRMYDAASGLVVWSGSKYYESSRDLESTGLKPVFRRVSEDFLLTMPASRSGGAAMRMSR